MGNILSRSVDPDRSGYPEERKRKRDDDSSISNLGLLNTPKRKRLKSTSKYIYQTLFLEGEDSDINIRALGRDWKLHKLYLKQSPYFLSMFSGSWIESDMDTIQIDILDENITEEALKIAFGSLYKDDVFLKPVQIVSVLATATLFQLESLIEQCCIMMKETLSSCTVCVYYSTCQTYGLEELRLKCLDWLTRNILTTDNITFIRDIGVELMAEIISSSQLYVMQVEIDIYTMLKKWIFLCNNCDWAGDSKDLLKEVDGFFKKEMRGKSGCYLEREEGKKYFEVFATIRWYHVVNDISSIKMIENDKLLPMSCLNPMLLYGWRRMLSVEQGLDKGPEMEVDETVFNNSCIRCGRVLLKADDYCWRWVGYNYGVDLLVFIINGIISLKRNTQNCSQSVSLQDMRYLCYRYHVICNPIKARYIRSTKSAVLMSISLWATAVLVMLPHLWIQRLQQRLSWQHEKYPPIRIAHLCVEYFPKFSYNVSYSFGFLFIFYVLPVVVMIYAYGKMASVLWLRKHIGERLQQSQNNERREKQKRNIIRMLIIIVVCYIVCWLPFFAINVVILFCKFTKTIRAMQAFALLFGYSNAFVNALIYFFLNAKFNKLVKEKLGQFCLSNSREREISGKAIPLLSNTTCV